MEKIIAQIVKEMIEDILKNIEEIGISNIGETAESLLPVLKKGTLGILTAVIEETDKAILGAKKERKSDGITVKQRNVPRTIIR